MSVYKIDLNGNIYVGSTKNSLTWRRYGHKSSLKNIHNKNKLYSFMRENEITDFNLELLESCSADFLKIREEYYRKLLNANLNTLRCYTTENERLQTKNRKMTCSCGCNIRFDNRNRHLLSTKHSNLLLAV